MNAQNVMATYDIWSETYDETANPLIPIEEMTVRPLLRTIEYHDVLDAATRTGRHAIYFAEQGKRVSATDCNKKMLAKARAKARQQQLSIEFRLEHEGFESWAIKAPHIRRGRDCTARCFSHG